jgi:alkylated DNA repair dioxygenase AlkB
VDPVQRHHATFDGPQKGTTDLAPIPGLHYLPEFLSIDEQQQAISAIDAMPWRSDLKRRVQHYGYVYSYRSRRVDASMYLGPLPPLVVGYAEELFDQQWFAELPNQVIVNEYLPGQGIAQHVDCEPCFGDAIATISLGSVYSMDFLHRPTGERRSLRLELGSCLILSGEARYEWTHGIKPRLTDKGHPRDRRVSLTFRTVTG